MILVPVVFASGQTAGTLNVFCDPEITSCIRWNWSFRGITAPRFDEAELQFILRSADAGTFSCHP